MNSNIKVSIIIPVYNGAEFIRRSFDSCIYQTLDEIEVIAVNDCSPDERDAEIMREYERTYPDKFRGIFHKENKRQGGARNTGIKAARGEYFLCVDQDDFIELGMCEEMYHKAVEEYSDIVMCGYNFCSNGKIHYYEPLECKEENFRMFAPAVWKLLTRKQFIVENQLFFPERVVTDDVVSILWFMQTDQCCMINKPFYHWMRHASAESTLVTYRYCYSVPFSFIEISRYAAYQKLQDEKKHKFATMAAHYLCVSIINCAEYHADNITELCSMVKTALGILKPDFTREAFRNTHYGKTVATILDFVVEHLGEKEVLTAVRDFPKSMVIQKIKDCLSSTEAVSTAGNGPIVIWGAGIRGKRLAGYLADGDIPFEMTDSRETVWGEEIYGKRVRPWNELESSAHVVVFSPLQGFDDVKALFKTSYIKLLDFQDLM